jgi:ATP synthase protein I
MPDEPQGNPKWQRALELSSLGLALPSSIAVGLLFGYVLDRWLNTRPWMLLLFLLLGVVSGFVSLFRGLRRWDRKP